MARLVRRPMLAAVVVAVALAGGCAQSAGTSPSAVTASPKALSISNGTTIPVTLVVNGAVVETVAPGGYQDPITAPMPALPWAVETRSPSGRVLSSLTIGAADFIDSPSGKGARADLSCGRLDVWSGPPMLGPVFSHAVGLLVSGSAENPTFSPRRPFFMTFSPAAFEERYRSNPAAHAV